MAVPLVTAYWHGHNRIRFQEVEVTRGDIVSVVSATGTIHPMLRVHVGSFVSGPISELLVASNDKVKEGQLLARFDPRIYEATVARDKAALSMAKANVVKAAALFEQARHDERRAMDLRAINEEYLADTMMDQYKYNRISQEADLKTAQAAVEQAKAALANSEANLGYTEITSPVDGIVLERMISKGQTLTSQFTTPELFVLATEMDQQMKVNASVNEADIGRIRNAKAQKYPVIFTVDAYPQEIFDGEISKIRINSSMEQNVVTYPVVIIVPNPDMKLMPGMTANISFKVDERKDVVKIPNAALRFYPKSEQVRNKDKTILEGQGNIYSENEYDYGFNRERSAARGIEIKKKCQHRHVWMAAGEHLRAVKITTGISDNKFSELISGDIESGNKIVTGMENP